MAVVMQISADIFSFTRPHLRMLRACSLASERWNGCCCKSLVYAAKKRVLRTQLRSIYHA